MQIDNALNTRAVSFDRRPAVAVALLMAAASVSGCAGQPSEEVAPDPVAIAELGIDPHSVTCLAMPDEALAEPSSEPARSGGASTACPPGYELQHSDVAIDTNGLAPATAAAELQVSSPPTAGNGASTDPSPSFMEKAAGPTCYTCAQLKAGAQVYCLKKKGKTLCPGAQCVGRCGSTNTFLDISFSCC